VRIVSLLLLFLDMNVIDAVYPYYVGRSQLAANESLFAVNNVSVGSAGKPLTSA
jgi:hypothetical protein